MLGEGDHYELFLNPYSGTTARTACSSRGARDRAEPTGLPAGQAPAQPAHRARVVAADHGRAVPAAARFLPSLVAKRFDSLLKDMVDDGYTNVSYKVFNIGEANHLPAYSMELGVALEGGRHLEAVDRILAIAASGRPSGFFHTSPIALRFVAPSDAHASMMHGARR